MGVMGELIHVYRKENKLTQNEMVEALAIFSPNLKKLNTVTLSRWETGVTSPGLVKKRSILKFLLTHHTLAGSAVYAMIKERYRLLSAATESSLPGPNAALLGNLPAFDDGSDCLFDLQESEHQDTFLEHIVDIEKSTHAAGYCQLSTERLKAYLQAPSTFAVVCARKNHYLGHFIMLKINEESAEAIVHHRKSKYDISDEALSGKEERGSYIMMAIYASNPKYAMKLRTEAYLFLLENMATIKDFLIFSTRTNGTTMHHNYGIAEVAKGEDETYGFNWFGLCSPVEDILLSDTVIKLIF